MDDRILQLRGRIAGLSPAEQAALRAKVTAAGIDWSRVAPAGIAAPRPSRLPLSPSQMQFWLLQQVQPESAAFTIAFAWDVDGALDTDALDRALAYLIARHEPLRTRFPADGGEPWQEVEATVAVPLETRPWSRDDMATAQDFVARRFDLAAAPLFRVALLSDGNTRHRALFAFHHIIADGWSRGIFVRELAVCYRAFREGRDPGLPPLARQFADVVLEQADGLAGPATAKQIAFWRDELKDLGPQELGTTGNGVARGAGTLQHRLGKDLTRRAADGARRLGVSPFVLHLAVFQLLLHRLTGSDDIAVGTPTAGRGGQGAEALVGLFMNTLVLRGRPRAGLAFGQWVHELRDTLGRALEHQDLPFARVVEAVGANRRVGQTPLFQTLFQLQSAGYAQQNAERIDLGDPSLVVRQQVLPLSDAKFDLSWHMMEQPEGMSVLIEYRTPLFDEAALDRMIAQYETLLAAALDTPEAALERLEFVAPGTALRDVGREAEIPCLVSQIFRQASSGQRALVCEATGSTFAYADLLEKADRLARQLRARPELGEDSARIAICLPRGAPLVIAMLAALRAGISYVPLDPDHPPARRSDILKDADAALMLAERGTDASCPVLDPADLGPSAPMAELPPPDPERLAYLIFTSGSTGRPKGVAVTNRALSNLIASMAEAPGMTAQDRLLALTTVAFDIAALEILLPLAVGGTLILGSRRVATDPALLSAALDRHGITHMQATPATWRLLVESGWPGRAGLTALSGGEALSADLGRALLDRCGCVWNMYGPTETTIWSAALRLSPGHLDGAQVPIGGAIANTHLQVLDRYGTLLPEGVAGELAIGGAGLSRGYWNQPDLTAERFPATKDGLLYRTGDLVCWRADGTLSFLGRLDHQIKLNGYRVEPGEIETALTNHPAIAQALVLETAGRLVAYVRSVGHTPEAEALRRDLGPHLPAYMIPGVFVFLETFPLTANGKIDRARLPSPARGTPVSREAQTGDEKILLGLWREVLGNEGIGVEDNFFDHGGASVSALQIASRARAKGLHLTPAQMFEHQTVAAQAAAIQPDHTEPLPLSPWQIAHLARPGEFREVRVTLSDEARARVADAVATLAARHPVLNFALGATQWLANRAPEPVLHEGGSGEGEVHLGPLWHVRIEADALTLAAHPLLLDGVSLVKLRNELRLLLDGADPGPLPDPSGYSDWLRGTGAASPVPVALEPESENGEPVSISQQIAGPELRALRAKAQALNLPVSRLIAAAFASSIGAWRPGPVSFLMIDDAGQQALGNYRRAMGIALPRVPTDSRDTIRSITEAITQQSPLGLNPAEVPPSVAVLSWEAASTYIGAMPERPGLWLKAADRETGIELLWSADPTVLHRVTVTRLAARFLSELNITGRATGEHKLGRLKARLNIAGGLAG